MVNPEVTVRTRFAPSPTGYLHIGGVRTALFNWLLARKHEGQFILRIDDTDVARHVDGAVERILDGFRWLGLDWDEGPEVGGPYGPYFQSQRRDHYEAALVQLLQAGCAYPCRAKPEELDGARSAALAAQRPFAYRGPERDLSPDEAVAIFREQRTAVRFKVPLGQTTILDDAVRGRVEWQTDLLGDFTIARRGGEALYNFATVVDDVAMNITHVVRAEEHLSNTHPQLLIFRGLGAAPPVFAHVPYVAEPGSKSKLSKRKLDVYLKNRDFARVYEHGRRIAAAIGWPTAPETFNPVTVEFYEQVGYLPDALVNYLLLLGWSLDDKTEFFTRSEMVQHFSLERVNKAPASFDPQKLSAFQDRYLRALSTAEKFARSLPFLIKAGFVANTPSTEAIDMIRRIIEAAGDRIKVAGDVLDYVDFLVPDGALPYDEKAFDKRLRGDPTAVALIADLRERLAGLESFDAPSVEAAVNAFVAARGIKLGDIIHGLRVAVTGKAVGFGLFETLAILGKERTLRRLEETFERL